ncbi:MAG: hypothetical protein H0V18_04800 [Pyrinomonadaceae bacterium]|nr:hypothetical protein [Pyrinomonadaceae bacterium]
MLRLTRLNTTSPAFGDDSPLPGGFVELDPGPARKAACLWLPYAAPPALVELPRSERAVL